MNDEIKEIFKEWKQFLFWCYENNDKTVEIHRDKIEYVMDYITNLQQENERLKAQLTDIEWQYQNTRCKYEKQYIKGTTEEILEDIEQCFFNRESPTMIPIDSLDVCHIFGYIDYLKDYKSRCEKAIGYGKALMLGEATFEERHIANKFVNILQNGSDEE